MMVEKNPVKIHTGPKPKKSVFRKTDFQKKFPCYSTTISIYLYIYIYIRVSRVEYVPPVFWGETFTKVIFTFCTHVGEYLPANFGILSHIIFLLIITAHYDSIFKWILHLSIKISNILK